MNINRKTIQQAMGVLSSKKTQPARGWNAADICTNCVYKIPAPRDGSPIPFFLASRPSLPRLCSSQKRGTSIQILTWPHTPVIWICDLCHKQINKKQTSIRCNHTHNTHWVHLKCTQIKQWQYKPYWRCTIHTPTQKVTTTPSTAHHKQTTTHSQTTINQRTKISSYFKST